MSGQSGIEDGAEHPVISLGDQDVSLSVLPVVVVLAYERLHSLQRLLNGLLQADYPEGQSVKLVLSVDQGGDRRIRTHCDQFIWPFGEKQLVFHERQLGLLQHVLWAGDLSLEHGPVVVLEDDLMLSPQFYRYAMQALHAFGKVPSVACCALYHHQLNETCKRAFHPIPDGSDLYFLQVAASWGQCWTKDQWIGFRTWMSGKTHADVEAVPMAWDILKWPRSSWKKWFTAYLVSEGKYVAYPRHSLSTNFMENGTHQSQGDWSYQTVMDWKPRQWRWCLPEQSGARYDSYCELEAGILKALNPGLEAYDFDVDLNGHKRPEHLRAAFVLSSRPARVSERTFSRSLRPAEANVAAALPGTGLVLARRENLIFDVPVVLMDELSHAFAIPKKQLGKFFWEHLEKMGMWVCLKWLVRCMLSSFARRFCL
jgi:hypothetical protein